MRLSREFGSGKVGIVGSGPCGLILGLLLHSLGEKDFEIYDSKDHHSIINSHPAAHYINAKTFELLRPIEGLEDRIREASENLERYRYYRYVREIGGLTFQVTDQLKQDDLNLLKEYTDKLPAHMPQNMLQKVLLQEYEKKGITNKLKLGAQVSALEVQESGQVRVKLNGGPSTASGTQSDLKVDYDWLVLSDGFRSKLRNNFTNISMVGRECKVTL